MFRKVSVGLLAVALCVLSVALLGAEDERRERRTRPPIPGITGGDMMPSGCVDCHKNFPERQRDGRLSSKLKKWIQEVEPEVLSKAQATMPEGVKLKGKHPDVLGLIEVIPDDCLMCHRAGARNVPPFSSLMHAIHLTGRDNHFLSNSGGYCTHCHKLNKKTGALSLGSGKEERTPGK